MVRYTTDIATASAAEPHEGSAEPWARAAIEAHQAAHGAYRYLPPDQFTGKARSYRQLTSSLARNLDAAATVISAARETHFHTTTDGIRSDRSEWVHVVASTPVQRALPSDLARWSRQVVSHGSRLTSAASQPGPAMTEEQRRLLASAGHSPP